MDLETQRLRNNAPGQVSLFDRSKRLRKNPCAEVEKACYSVKTLILCSFDVWENENDATGDFGLSAQQTEYQNRPNSNCPYKKVKVSFLEKIMGCRVMQIVRGESTPNAKCRELVVA